jgi:TatD DNase family protein
MLIDSHAHLHFDAYAEDLDAVLRNAHDANVTKIITVGVNTADSRKAVELATKYENVWASVGMHPHDATEGQQGIGYIADLAGESKVVAIGECGLDYFKSTTSRREQEQALRLQIELAQRLDKPVIFHVREAFEDFFRIVDDYRGVRGVVHSFTGSPQDMTGALDRGFFIALNGIMTFTKDESQLAAAKQLPLDRLLLETDCPFLSPKPNRGKRNEPAATREIAESLAAWRGETIEKLESATTRNSEQLFGI